MHLRDPESLADFALGQVLLEAQAQDLALAFRQLCQPALQHDDAFCPDPLPAARQTVRLDLHSADLDALLARLTSRAPHLRLAA